MKTNTKSNILFLGLIFAFFFIYFSIIHPVVISDADDWLLCCFFRPSIPLWGYWNPARIFAEVFMPLASKIAAYTIFPITGDIFGAFTIMYALVLAFVITSLMYLVYSLFYAQNQNKFLSALYVFCFIISHFLMFRCWNGSNINMFSTTNACTFFYYVIPNLINCIFVLLIMIKQKKGEPLFCKNILQNSLLIVLIYFCIFSNIWASIISISFICAFMAKKLFTEFKSTKSIAIKNYYFEIAILVVWLVSQIFELNGERAAVIQTSFFAEIKNVIINLFYNFVTKINQLYIIFVIITFILGIFAFFKNKEHKEEIFTLVGATFIFTAYIVLSCSRTGARYASRPDVIYGAFFFFQLVLLIMLDKVMANFKLLQNILPLCLLVLMLHIDTVGNTFIEHNDLRTRPEIINKLNNDIVAQMQKAEANGEETVDIYVPYFPQRSDNWPYTYYIGARFTNMTYEYGLINKYITVSNIIPTNDKNIELGIPDYRVKENFRE